MTAAHAAEMSLDEAALIRQAADRHFMWLNVPKDALEPLILHEGEGVRVKDVDGKPYIDLVSSFSRASSLGYGQPDVIEAIHAQLGRLHYAGTTTRVADTTIRLAQRLAGIAPGPLEACLFVSTGSEANETAIKLAKMYHRHAGRKPRAYKVISRWGAYHGVVGSALACTDFNNVRQPFDPGVAGISHIPAPTSYRCPFDLDLDAWGRLCADYLEQQILHEGPELVAAFIAEPIMQANGTQVPPDGYLRRVREICTKYDVLFIADEVITGYGRTGDWFAVNHWDVVPDIITCAKALTAGYMPLAAVIASREVWDALPVMPDVHTYAGPPAAAAAVLAVTDVLERDGLLERSRTLGAAVLERLRALEQLDHVGQVRGKGMWMSIDFTADKDTRAVPDPELLKRIVRRGRELGVLLTQTGTAIEVVPSINIPQEDLDEGLALAERAIAEGAQPQSGQQG